MDPGDAISPVDGRYNNKTKVLSTYFSEAALMRYRCIVEIRWLEFLNDNIKIINISQQVFDELNSIIDNWNLKYYQDIKKLEKTCNHDVKAVELFIASNVPSDVTRYVHLGITSNDVNSVAQTIQIRDAMEEVFHPMLGKLGASLVNLSLDCIFPMLCRTHGQPATPDIMKNQLMVFRGRLDVEMQKLKKYYFTTKFGGAVGNNAALKIIFPAFDINEMTNKFIMTFGLIRQSKTTQIENYDNLIALFDIIRRINTIMIDFCYDMWEYISRDYFKLANIAGEVGSSTMPHKTNPIQFENAIGNLQWANGMIRTFGDTLPVSRMQRDLTGSTITRNFGVMFAHCLLAYKSIMDGVNRIAPNKEAIADDLNDHWEVIAEGIQTILRINNYPNPYDAVKQLTKGKKVTRESIHEWVDSLDTTPIVKDYIKQMTPNNYF